MVDFNSIKVRLELTYDDDHLPLFSYFNSIKVRLERTPSNALKAAPVFQFHKGTIRTIVLLSLKPLLISISIP